MTNRERVKAAISHKESDRLPVSFDLTQRALEKICAYYRIQPDEFKPFINDSLDYVGIIAPEGKSRMEGNVYINEFGVEFDMSDKNRNMGDWGDIRFSPISEPTLAGYDFPRRDPSRYRHWDVSAMEASNNYQILAIEGLFDVAWHMTGFEDFMYYMAGEEAFAAELLDRALEFNIGLIETAPAVADGVRFGEDWGLQKGLMMGGTLWRRLLKPRLKEMYAAARKKGLDVFIHSCGDISELFPDLIEIGVQVINPIQPEAMDVEFLKREYGRDIALYGGVSCQHTLPLGTPEELKRECERLRDTLGRGGGYIFGPSGAIPTDAKIENLIVLIEFTKML